jgi:hypothetical protein
MIAVFDSIPLILPSRIDSLALLRPLPRTILVPDAKFREVAISCTDPSCFRVLMSGSHPSGEIYRLRLMREKDT